MDRLGFVTYANPALGRLLERPTASILDKPIALLFPVEVESFAVALLPDGEGKHDELALRRDDGTLAYLSVSTSRLHLSDGSHAGTVAFLRDVTGQRHFEAELERKNAELEQYVHTVSHDLRSPLVSLIGFARLLNQDYGDRLDDKGRHFLERIEQASRTMEHLISDLLELSRIGPAPRRCV